METERLYRDAEGAWICKKHKDERGSNKYGSNCYRCLRAKYEQLQADILDWRRQRNTFKYENEQLQAEADNAKETYDQLFLDFVSRGIEIKELQAELGKHRWIPVEEKLPEKENYVFIIGMPNGYASTALYHKKNRHWRRYSLPIKWTVTHWKPIALPERKEEDGEYPNVG